MGDPLDLPTPLAVPEAPLVWTALTAGAAAVPCAFLVWVFSNERRREAWRQQHRGRVPWFAVHGEYTFAYAVLLVAWVLCTALSYWISRGGHLYVHRISVATPFYIALALFAAWAAPLRMMPASRVLPALVLALVFATHVFYTVEVYISLPLIAGGIATAACVCDLLLLAAWWCQRSEITH